MTGYRGTIRALFLVDALGFALSIVCFFPGTAFEPSNMNVKTQAVVREMHGVIAELRPGPDGGYCLPSHFRDEYRIVVNGRTFIEYRYRRDCWAVSSKNLKDWGAIWRYVGRVVRLRKLCEVVAGYACSML